MLCHLGTRIILLKRVALCFTLFPPHYQATFLPLCLTSQLAIKDGTVTHEMVFGPGLRSPF